MAKVVLSQAAKADLDDIYGYIGRENHSPAAADRLLRKIDEKCRLYAGQPELGELRPDLALDMRIFPVGNYVVFYFPTRDGIYVARVIEGHRNYPEMF